VRQTAAERAQSAPGKEKQWGEESPLAVMTITPNPNPSSDGVSLLDYYLTSMTGETSTSTSTNSTNTQTQ
jgi:hypothetical protein